jgi:hypothetical protein
MPVHRHCSGAGKQRDRLGGAVAWRFDWQAVALGAVQALSGAVKYLAGFFAEFALNAVNLG